MENLMNNAANRELTRLFLEASGLVVKLTHKLENADIKGTDLHLAAARDFIHRNQLYAQTLGVLLKETSNKD